MADERATHAAVPRELIIYSHSSLFYWWPVWVAGYAMAIYTHFQGGMIPLDEARQTTSQMSSVPGLIFTAVLLAVILITNVRVRGVASLAVVLAIAFVVVLFGWLHWWDDILRALPQLAVHLNLGFYLLFSTALLIIWLLAFFVFDRLTYWRVRPGQITLERMIGGGEKSYDTQGILFEQHGDDFFRHIILGLGAGDLKLMTTGARKETIEIENVLFAQRKVAITQRLVAIAPDSDLTA